MNYKQLTENKKCQIDAMNQAGHIALNSQLLAVLTGKGLSFANEALLQAKCRSM